MRAPCLTPAGIFRLAAGQRSFIANERLQSVQQNGGRHAAHLQQILNSDVLQTHKHTVSTHT